MTTLNKRNPIAKAVKFALLAGATVSAISAPSVFAEEAKEEGKKLTITGSRIKRTDLEGALPVTVIDRESIEMSGETSAADFVRNLTFNSSGSFRPQSGSSAQGVSQLSLRGIGASRTLVLVDGRRLPKSPSTGSSQDLNTIPMGAIERIEIMTDGASAVYGSDAIGGVVNVITRDDYEGAEIMLGQSSVSIPANGGDREEGSIVFGAAGEKSSIIAGVSWNNRDIIFARDFPWNPGGGSVFGNNFTTLAEGGGDNYDFVAIPDGEGGTACGFPGTAFFEAGGLCRYDYTQVSADEASTGNKSLWVKAKHEINQDWQIWANASVNKTNSFGRYAPVPDGHNYMDYHLSAGSPNNPTNPDGNVYDGVSEAQEVNIWHRFDALGNRDNTVDNELTDLQVGATGMVGDVELDFGMRSTKNRTFDIGRNYLLRSAAFDAIETGAYDLRDPFAADEDVLNGMKVTISRLGTFDQKEMWASASFEMMELGGGVAQMVVGAEYREEIYADMYDSLSEAGQVGGSSGNSAGGDRDVTAFYFEALLPVTDDLELNVAGRYDDYSDYGSDFSPKLSARWQPIDDLTLRASYGQGFRAPTLDILTQKDSFSADSVRDPQSCLNQGQVETCELQINGLRTANDQLSSENSDQYAFGVAYQPADWVSLSVDYWNISIDNRIKFFGAQTLVNAEQNGDPIPAGLGVERSANGSITRIVQGYGNEGALDTSGIDINVQFNYELFGGNLASTIQFAHLIDQTVVDNGERSRDFVTDAGLPQQMLVISNMFSIDDFSFGYNLNLKGSQCDEEGDGGCTPGRVPTWVTHDVQFNYQTPWEGKFTVGVQNLGEKYPPLGVGFMDGRDYDFNLYSGYGRTTYFRYTQSF